VANEVKTGKPGAKGALGAGFDEQLLSQVIDHLDHPVFVKDRAFRFVLVNAACCVFLGFSREQLIGKTDYDFFPKTEANFFRAKDEEMFRRGQKIVIDEERITVSDGSARVLATTKVPLFDAAGNITHLVGIISDITHIKRVEEELRRANEGLEHRVQARTRELELAQDDLMRKERLAVLGKLAGGVAHQIRNPLGVIKNAAYVIDRVLREGGLPDATVADARTAVTIVHDEVDRANRTITGLLEYARTRAPMRAPENAEQILRASLARIDLGEVTVTWEVEELPEVLIDRDQVADAFEIVLRNAVEAMARRGTLTLRMQLSGRYCAILICDTGPGVDPSARDKLFEPLVTTKASGIGLGLVTAKTLVEGQGGTIWMVDDGTPGATFELRFPLAPQGDKTP